MKDYKTELINNLIELVIGKEDKDGMAIGKIKKDLRKLNAITLSDLTLLVKRSSIPNEFK